MPQIHFVLPESDTITVEATVGSSILEVARQYQIDLEGACDGSLACSTCHVIIDESWFTQLPPATEQEEDMLDLAFGLVPTSRLGCQIVVTPEMDGLVLRLPHATRHL